jgi:phage-related protein
MNRISERVDSAGNGLKKFAGVVAGAFAFGAVAEFGKKLINTASDAAEMQSKFDTVFGDMNANAEAWASQFQASVGGSRVEIKGMIADSQDLLTGFGATTSQALDFSTKMQMLGTDLASFQNVEGGASEAVERLRSGLMGEHDALKSLGIVINDTTLAQELAKEGDKRKFQELSELEKMNVRYQVALSQTKNAEGDAAKTSEGFANQMRNLEGRIVDAAAKLGEKLLPIATTFVNFMSDKLPVIEDFIFKGVNELAYAFKLASDNADILIPIIEGVTAAIVAQFIISKLTALMNAYRAATVTMTAAQWLLNAAMSANPLGLIALAIGAVVTAGVLLYKNWDIVKEKAEALWVGIKNAFLPGVNFVIDKINKLIGIINKIPGVEKPLIAHVQTQTTSLTEEQKNTGFRSLDRYASGTNFAKGGMSLVGEMGPELLNIPRGSQVIPNNKSMAMLKNANSSGGGINITVENMHIRNESDIRAVAREIFNLTKIRERSSGLT